MNTAAEIANYFLSLVDTEAGDSMSNLKLQKLVYYAQGFHLAITGKPLFEDAIMAWEHGPVIPSLYHSFKQHGAESIPPPENGVDTAKYSVETREILDEVFSVYGQFSAWKLRNMTHEEPPWKEVYSTDSPIRHETMRQYFSTLLNEQAH